MSPLVTWIAIAAMALLVLGRGYLRSVVIDGRRAARQRSSDPVRPRRRARAGELHVVDHEVRGWFAGSDTEPASQRAA